MAIKLNYMKLEIGVIMQKKSVKELVILMAILFY